MALVGYSDSEGSEDENSAPAPTPKATPKPQPNDAPRRIRVNLPAPAPEPEQDELQSRPAKRARTAGAFSGFNSLLPPPKRAAPAKGVALKTSSEAAFSRHPIPVREDGGLESGEQDMQSGDVAKNEGKKLQNEGQSEEPKLVGKATRFRPLSVANNRMKKTVRRPPVTTARPLIDGRNGKEGVATNSTAEDVISATILPSTAQPPKPKKSLFSIHTGDDPSTSDNGKSKPVAALPRTYEPLDGLSTTDNHAANSELPFPPNPTQQNPYPSDPPSQQSTLEALASDLNLTHSQRRQLLGRNSNNTSKTSATSIVHFDLDAEYAANAAAAAAGEASAPTRAVRAIAPGKHSLKQLVDNARGQQDALEEKWAAGRAERGEAGGRYGWT